MPKCLDPEKLKIGYIILIASRKLAIEKFQAKAGHNENSKWTHVAGSLGGYTAIEANFPRSRLINLQKECIDKGYEIKVLKRKDQEPHKRYKVALWWATMNNLPYDTLQFFWFPLSLLSGRICIILHNLFSSRKRFLCSELIATGFYKEGDYLFNKPASSILPAEFSSPAFFRK